MKPKKMKEINRTSRSRTVLSVSPDRVILNIGTDIKEERLQDFLSVLDGLISDEPMPKEPYYGHFSFSRNKMEVTMSRKKDKPSPDDPTYNYEL